MQKKEKTTHSKSWIDSFLSIGKIVSTFGLKGDLKINPSGDALQNIKKKHLLHLNEETFFEIVKIQKHKNIFLTQFKDIDSIEKAEKLIGSEIFISKEEAILFLKKNEFYQFQILGFHPISKEKILTEYKLDSILDNPAHPILTFKNLETEILIPFLNQFIGKIDLEKQTIEVLNWDDWLEI